MTVGRNELCPCGSGLKYKRCCGGPPPLREATPDDACWLRYRLLKNEYRQQMATFVDQTFETETIDAAWAVYVDPISDILGIDLPLEFDPETPASSLFMPWFYHHWVVNDDDDPGVNQAMAGSTPTELFLTAQGARVSDPLRQYLHECMNTFPEFYEVVSVERERGFAIRGCISNVERYVFDRGASKSTLNGKILFAHVVPFESIHVLEAAPPWALAPEVLVDVKRVIHALDQPGGTAQARAAFMRRLYFGLVAKLYGEYRED